MQVRTITQPNLGRDDRYGYVSYGFSLWIEYWPKILLTLCEDMEPRQGIRLGDGFDARSRLSDCGVAT